MAEMKPGGYELHQEVGEVSIRKKLKKFIR
jgi:hypothetical protein